MGYCLWLVAEARPDRGRGGGVRGGLGRSGEATLPDASRERARQELQLSLLIWARELVVVRVHEVELEEPLRNLRVLEFNELVD